MALCFPEGSLQPVCLTPPPTCPSEGEVTLGFVLQSQPLATPRPCPPENVSAPPALDLALSGFWGRL